MIFTISLMSFGCWVMGYTGERVRKFGVRAGGSGFGCWVMGYTGESANPLSAGVALSCFGCWVMGYTGESTTLSQMTSALGVSVVG